jgi:hypothetical protein
MGKDVPRPDREEVFAVPKISKDLDISAFSRDNSEGEANVKINQTLNKSEFFGIPMGKM